MDPKPEVAAEDIDEVTTPEETSESVSEQSEEERSEQKAEQLMAAIDEELADLGAPKEEVKSETTEADKEGDLETAEAQEAETDEQKSKEKPDTEPAEATAEKTEPAKEEKPSDQFGDLPENTKKETRERFEAMKHSFDEMAGKLETVESQNKEWFDTLERIKTNPDQLGLTFEYLSLVNQGTPEALEKAYTFMERELGVLGQALGKAAPGYDPLESHPDLKEEFENGEISKERALEIAHIRASSNIHKQRDEQTQTKQEAQITEQTAINDLKTLGSRLRSADPFFESKVPALQGIVKAVCRPGTNPKEWIPAIEDAYAELPNPTVRPRIPSVPNPIRPGNVSPGQSSIRKEPQSALEAVENALDGL